MSLLPTRIYSNPAAHYCLVRCQDQQNSKAIEECIAQSAKSPKSIKLCRLLGDDFNKKQGEAKEYASKCKDKSCAIDCFTAAYGFDIEAFFNFPFNQVDDKCQKENPTGKEHHKYDEASCISKKLGIPEDKIKEIRDCPESKCMSASGTNEYTACLKDCFKQGDDLVKRDKKKLQNPESKSQSGKSKSSTSSDASSSQSHRTNASGSESSIGANSANDSRTYKITTSGLVTVSLIVLTLSGSNQ